MKFYKRKKKPILIIIDADVSPPKISVRGIPKSMTIDGARKLAFNLMDVCDACEDEDTLMEIYENAGNLK